MVTYPLKVNYCPNCSMPFEFCEYYPDYEGCKRWLQANLPDQFASLMSAEAAKGDAGEEDKKRQKRGGKGQIKAKKNVETPSSERRIVLYLARRGKKKAVTVVQGLTQFGIDLRDASKYFGQRFACGCSVTGDDELVIQGDFKDDLIDVITDKWQTIDENMIDDVGEKKRTTT